MTVAARIPPRVLVVDDDGTIRALVRLLLEGHGCSVTEADCAAQALTRCRESMPDFIFLDAVLPDTDGFALCRQIRTLPHGLGTPIIMATGLDGDHAQDMARRAGATACIGKPIDIDGLDRIIARLIRQHG